jgi:hypothetical protein
MATIPATSDYRIGAVRNRSQFFNTRNQRWIKRNAQTGRFMEVKHDAKKFKGIRREA